MFWPGLLGPLGRWQGHSMLSTPLPGAPLHSSPLACFIDNSCCYLINAMRHNYQAAKLSLLPSKRGELGSI